jgi:hypothetical protein
MLRAVDDWLVDSVFQRIADWISDRYQKSVFITARICVYLDLVNLMLKNIIESKGKANILDFGLSSLWPLILLVLIRTEEDEFERRGYGAMNSLRMSLRLMRFIYIILIPLGIGVNIARLINGSGEHILILTSIMGSLFISSAVFFASCTPKPPKPKEEEQEIPADAAFET